MKWMGWSLDQLNAAPVEYVDTIIDMMYEEQREIEKLRNR